MDEITMNVFNKNKEHEQKGSPAGQQQRGPSSDRSKTKEPRNPSQKGK